MPRQGSKRKKKRTEKHVEASEREKRSTPRCFVLKRGAIGDRVRSLVQDFRMLMMPNCAKSLRESKSNRIEDFIAVAGHFGVSHLVIFTATKLGTYMKLIKLPQGPTLTFKVRSFSLMRDVRAAQRRPRSAQRDFTSAPLQVLNGFSIPGGAATKVGTVGTKECGERVLTAEMFRGLFPAIDVPSFNQSECRRVVLFHRDTEQDAVHLRHFSVARRPVGLQGSIERLLHPGRLPNLARREDLADFVLGGPGARAGVGGGAGNGSGCSDDSEVENEEAPDCAGDSGAGDRTVSSGGKVAVRLTEVGPRLEIQLVKIEEGVLGGAVIYHRYLTRTPTELEVLEKKAKQRRKLKERNAKLEAEVEAATARRRARRENKAAADTKAGASSGGRSRGGGNDEESATSDAGGGGAEGGAHPAKKPRHFHPFAWGAKATRQAAAGGSTGEQKRTVEIDSGVSRKRQRGGGKRGAGQQRVLDRFQASQRSR